MGRVADLTFSNLQGVTLTNCATGFYLTEGGLTQDTQTVGSEVILDATVNNVQTFIQTSVVSALLHSCFKCVLSLM